MISEKHVGGGGWKKVERKGAKAFSQTHILKAQRESQEERDGLELYSLFIALLPFTWGSSLCIAFAIVALNCGIVACKQ